MAHEMIDGSYRQTNLPNESREYLLHREALRLAELELRALREKVAEIRRHLPPGPAVKDYELLEGPASLDSGDAPVRAVRLSELFTAPTRSLIVYHLMYGKKNIRPCPMCTDVLASWDGIVPDITDRIALAVTARSPIDRLLAVKRERGWRHLPLYSDLGGAFSRDYRAIAPDGSDIPQILIFTRRDGTIRHFWAGEMGFDSADPGQDPRGAPEPSPLWTILDMTPEGRAPDWYPKLDY